MQEETHHSARLCWFGDTSPLFQKRCPPSTSLWSPRKIGAQQMPQGLGNFQEARRKREEATPSETHLGVSENSVPLFTQWFCWSLSLLNGYFIGNIAYFQTNPFEYPNRCNTLGNASSSSEALFKPEEIHCNDPPQRVPILLNPPLSSVRRYFPCSCVPY